MQNGTGPRLRKKTDYSYERTFGATFALPTELNLDAGLTMPDQNAIGMPYGCTGMTQADISGDEDGAIYDPHFTYDKTRLIENTVGQDVGCLIEDSIKSTRVYGVKKPSETEQQARDHRRGQYFDVDRQGGNYFDAFRSALYLNKRAISVGSIWYPVWEQVTPHAILAMPTTLNLSGPWHNYAIKGWKLINGVPYLMVKSWQGAGYGDHGWAYMSREVCNAVFSVSGTQAFTYAHASPEDVQLVRRSIQEVLLSLYLRLLALWSAKTGPTPAPAPQTPVPPPQPAPEPPDIPEKPTKIVIWALAIQKQEGWHPGSRSYVCNNPGNMKYASLTASLGATKGPAGADGGNFCAFKSYAAGFDALCQFLTFACKNELAAYHNKTLAEFTEIYAHPPSNAYSQAVASALGVSPSTLIKELL